MLSAFRENKKNAAYHDYATVMSIRNKLPQSLILERVSGALISGEAGSLASDPTVHDTAALSLAREILIDVQSAGIEHIFNSCLLSSMDDLIAKSGLLINYSFVRATMIASQGGELVEHFGLDNLRSVFQVQEDTRFEKEKKIVISQRNMIKTIEYSGELCFIAWMEQLPASARQMLTHLHAHLLTENKATIENPKTLSDIFELVIIGGTANE